MEIPFVLYADTESLFEKTQKCENNLEKSFAAKVVVKHTACGFSILTFHLTTGKINMITTEAKTP